MDKTTTNTISRANYRLSKTDLNKFNEWLRYLSIINNKPTNKQVLFNYFFDKFASAPQLFYLFLEFFKVHLTKETNQDKKKNLAQKYLDILSPLCERFNFFEEKNLLNDLCFQITNPEKYAEIKEVFAKYGKTAKKTIKEILDKLNQVLSDKGFNYELIGRYKNIYSIYKKMLHRPNSLLKMNDIFAFRIILNDNSIRRCFEVLNLLHDRFYPVPQSFKDYINIPKINGYQSLHTGLNKIIDDLSLTVEIQIRTREMNDFAENGLAAHWLYSQHKKSHLLSEKEQKLLDYLSCIGHTSENDPSIVCFSYSGEIIRMPKNSTLLDFAYKIHTDIGNTAKGALVNNTSKPLYYRLKEGDQIKIISADTPQVQPKWLNYAHTKYAYKKIFESLKTYAKKK